MEEAKDTDKAIGNHKLFIQGESAEFCGTKLTYTTFTPLLLNLME